MSNNLKHTKTMISPFFIFSNQNPMSRFKLNDLFEVRQGRQNITGESTDTKKAKVLTLKSVNFDNMTINPSLLLDYTSSSEIDENSYLTANSYIVNRVGRNRGMSLLNLECNFEEPKLIAGNDFIYFQPRMIILDNLEMFHAILDVNLFDDALKKAIEDEKPKLNYLTVKQLQEREIPIPSENFSEMAQKFIELYEPYKKSLQNFNLKKKKLEEFKNEFLKINFK